MAANVDAKVDFTAILSEIMKSEYGLVFICSLLFLIVLAAFLYMFGKSGIISHFKIYTEYSNKKFLREIEQKEELLNDEALSEFKGDMEYHIKVSKLENFLKFKNKDIDLLKYIMSCRDSQRAIRLYKKGSEYLEKDKETKVYRFKPKYTKESIQRQEKRTLYFYFGINALGGSPFFLKLISSRYPSFISFDFDVFEGTLFFIICFIISIIYTFNTLRPYSALYFLEIEKINESLQEQNIANNSVLAKENQVG